MEHFLIYKKKTKKQLFYILLFWVQKQNKSTQNASSIEAKALFHYFNESDPDPLQKLMSSPPLLVALLKVSDFI